MVKIEDLNRYVDKKPLPDGLFIIGRRWFQRSYGNTYHTVEIKDVFSQKQIIYTDMEYGYGDQYKDTAHRTLKALGYDVPDSYGDFIRAPGVDFTVIDVDRKRDL